MSVEEPAQVTSLMDAIRHRALVIAAIAVGFLWAGVGVVLVTPRTYEARAMLFVDVRWNVPQEFDVAVQASDYLSRYYIQQASSRRVLERVVADTGSRESADQLAKRVTAKPVKGTNLIGVFVQAPSGERAAQMADSVAKAVVDQNRADVTQRLQATKQYLADELDRLDGAIKEAQAGIQQLQQPGQQAIVAARQSQLAALQTEHASTFARAQEVALAQARGSDAILLVERAQVPSRPLRPQPALYLLVALVSGLGTGLLIALLLERFDDRLFSAESLARVARTPLVISIPGTSSKGPGHDPAADPYLVARETLLARYPQAHTVLVVAASSRDRADQVAGRLSAVAAATGERVLLLQADGTATGVLPPPSHNGFATVPVGSREEARVALRSLADRAGGYDVGFVSVPAPMANPIGLSVARLTDLTILVATAGVTRAADVYRTADSLRQAGAQVVGAILLGRSGFWKAEWRSTPPR